MIQEKLDVGQWEHGALPSQCHVSSASVDIVQRHTIVNFAIWKQSLSIALHALLHPQDLNLLPSGQLDDLRGPCKWNPLVHHFSLGQAHKAVRQLMKRQPGIDWQKY